MISTNEEVNSPMEQGSNSLLERQMATLEDSERYNERPSAQPNSPMELTSFFARPVATQESSLPSLAQERSRDRSNRSINGIRKWHIEPAAGKRYLNSYQLLWFITLKLFFCFLDLNQCLSTTLIAGLAFVTQEKMERWCGAATSGPKRILVTV